MAPKVDIAWTLRCKIHTVTIMVSLPKSSSLTTLKTEIVDLLKGAYPGGTIDTEEGSIPIPESISEIGLGKLIDAADIRSGWGAIEDDSSDTPLNGKGKAVAGRALQNGASKTTLESAGLKDFALVGMRFKGFEGLVQSSIEDENAQDDWPIVLPQTKAPIDEDEDDIPGLSHVDPETGRPVLVR